MPRGRAKKQSAEVEALPPEDSQPSQKVIKHKTEWVEVVEDAPEEIGEEFDDTEIDDKPRKKTRNAIQEMRKKLRAQGVTPSSNLRLYIERYIHSETDAGGSWAETEFCTKYSTTEEHVLDKGYMDTASKWGPGKYRITIRMDNRILDAFDVRISAAPTSPMVQHVNPNDPNSPQVIFQTSDGQQAMPSLKEVWKAQREALKEQLEMAKLRWLRRQYRIKRRRGQINNSEVSLYLTRKGHYSKAICRWEVRKHWNEKHLEMWRAMYFEVMSRRWSQRQRKQLYEHLSTTACGMYLCESPLIG